MSSISRRGLLGTSALLGAAPLAARAPAPVQASWESLSAHFRTPDWFRDAKLGIWSHWGPQCVPEWGDWYARKMYVQGNPFYDHHLKTCGHPADTGFIDIIGRWQADKWQPEALAARFKAAGARYLVSMANHHDNFDNFASQHHAWNSTRVGPRRDIVGTWAKVARAQGLRFGVSNHAAHAWHWLQAAYGYDPEGSRRGQRYDAFRLRKADGRGKYWQGLDPQMLYTGPSMVVPDGIVSIAAMDAWHLANDRKWTEAAPVNNPGFSRSWLARQVDLVRRYDPDLVYFDNEGLPLEQFGLEAAAQFYNQSIAQHGRLEGVLTCKKLDAAQRSAITEDVERGWSADIRPQPWQTCTCIGDWHYDRKIYDARSYKSAEQVIQRLCDVVSKNGNLLLSVPQRGDGSIDSEEEKVLEGMAAWTRINGEAIFASRPWRRFGEGPVRAVEGMMNEAKTAAFSAQDVRFTVRGGALYAAFMAWPVGPVRIASLAAGASPVRAGRVSLLGGGSLPFTQGASGLELTLPERQAGAFVPVLRIEGEGIAPSA